jgi:hypothetical protein
MFWLLTLLCVYHNGIFHGEVLFIRMFDSSTSMNEVLNVLR